MAEDYFGIVGTTQAGAYRVEAVVAEGGFGVVYRAFHDAFQAPVALKCLKIPQQMNAEHQAEFLTKFREEAALLFRLSASIPSVVRPLHVDKLTTSDNRFVPFMALEWLEGEGLDALIARRAAGKLPPIGLKKTVRLLAPVARALARAHHFPGPDGPVSIVHRDLKPDNIFLARVNGDEVVKIFDFGIAKARSVATQVAGRLSQGGSMAAFTPGYGAPEQWLPKRFGQTGPWTDVFGLALTVMETATGRPIIDGDTAGMMGTACDEKRRPTPRNEGLEVSDEVEAVFLAGLAVDPRRRYPDAGAFWDALESALGLELSATPTLGGSARIRDKRAEGGLRAPKEDDVSAALPPRAPIDRYSQTEAAPDSGDIELSLRKPAARPVRRAATPPTPPTSIPSIPDIELAAPAPAKPIVAKSQNANPAPPPTNRVAPPPEDPSSGDSSDDIELTLDIGNGPRVEGVSDGAPARMPSAREDLRTSRASVPDARPGRGTSSGTSGSFAKVTVTPTEAPRPEMVMTPARRRDTPMSRIRMPLWVGVAGIGLALGEQIYSSVTGRGLLELGPLRLTWIAGIMITFGVVMVMKRLIFEGDGR